MRTLSTAAVCGVFRRPVDSRTRAHRSRLVLVGTGLVLAAAVTGCGSQKKNNDVGEPHVGAISSVHSASDIVLPLDSYLPSDATSRTIANALSILVQQCMAGFGLTFPASQTSSTATGDPEPRNARRYFVIDAASAAVNGYHPSAEARQAQEAIAAQRTQGPALSTDVVNVMEGKGPSTYNGKPVPHGGCSRESARELGGTRADTVTIDA